MDYQTQQHVNIANRFFAIATELGGSPSLQHPCPDWAAIIAFYSAVHFVNAFMWQMIQQEPHDHRQRKDFVNANPVLSNVAAEYERLLTLSHDRRYKRLPRISQQAVIGAISDMVSVQGWGERIC